MNGGSFARAELRQLELGTKVATRPMSAEDSFRLVDFKEQSKFKNVVSDDADMTETVLQNTVFEHSSFEKTIPRRAELKGVIFNQTTLSGACLAESILSGNSDEDSAEA